MVGRSGPHVERSTSRVDRPSVLPTLDTSRASAQHSARLVAGVRGRLVTSSDQRPGTFSVRDRTGEGGPRGSGRNADQEESRGTGASRGGDPGQRRAGGPGAFGGRSRDFPSETLSGHRFVHARRERSQCRGPTGWNDGTRSGGEPVPGVHVGDAAPQPWAADSDQRRPSRGRGGHQDHPAGGPP